MSFGRDLRVKVLLDIIVSQEKGRKKKKKKMATTKTFIKGSRKFPLNSNKSQLRKLHVIMRGTTSLHKDTLNYHLMSSFRVP